MNIKKDNEERKKYIQWDDVTDLGLVIDSEIAKRYGVTRRAVSKARKARKIKALNPVLRHNIDWNTAPLGKYTDQYIADIFGCSGTTVQQQRAKRKIPSHNTLYRTKENQGAYYGESIIDLWLHDNDVAHEFQKKIGPYRVDWLLTNNVVWEFVGMWNHPRYGEQYRANFAIKEKYLTNNGYTVITIHETELKKFKATVNIKEILSLGDFVCSRCKRNDVKHSSFGFCHRCYMRERSGKQDSNITSPLKPEDHFECSECQSTNRVERVKNLCVTCYKRHYSRNQRAKDRLKNQAV